MANRNKGNRNSGNQSQTQSRDQSGRSNQSNQESALSVKEALDELMKIEGAVGGAVVDYENGMTLGTAGGRNLDMELAGAGNTEVVRSERKILQDLGLDGEIEDLLISLETSYHLIRMCQNHEDVFIYLVIDRDQGNLGLSRRSIDKIDERLELN
jgi:predicted regulator of Ras-like GTPase activity (Roadblock/LC7/MglB family)